MDRKNTFKISNIDYVLVSSKDFRVLYNSRYDRISAKEKENKSLFELYPTLSKKNSSIAKTMATGEVIFNEMQEFADSDGKVYVTQNITFPIFRDGKISGAVELTKDLTNVAHVKKKKEYFDYLETQAVFHSGRETKEASITFDDLITADNVMRRAIEEAKIHCANSNPVLIYGETGTGKELIAQSMINALDVPKEKVVVQNCAAIPENLLETIFFGTRKGSYTGAENKKGLFEEADSGVIFLDELDSLPLHIQGKLLRVVQDGSFRPIGSSREKSVQTKIIATVNNDPLLSIEEGKLRKDLFYRFTGAMIYLPPLRERKTDISLLIDYYLNRFNRIYNKNVRSLTADLEKLFSNYSWEGNVRELKHVIESMVSISSAEVLDEDQIPIYLHKKIIENLHLAEDPVFNSPKKGTITDYTLHISDEGCDFNQLVADFEKMLLGLSMKKNRDNKTEAAKFLRIPRQTLKYKLNKYGM